MIDLSPAFNRAITSKDWSRNAFLNKIALISQCFPHAVVDWEEFIPEQWARLVVQENNCNHCIAALLFPAPVLLISQSFSDQVLNSAEIGDGIEIVSVPDDWSTPILRIDRNILEALLQCHLPESPVVDFDRISVNDLYAVTVTM